MSDATTIAGWVTTWDSEPSRAQLPVRCLEDELLPPVSLVPPKVITTERMEKLRPYNRKYADRRRAEARAEARAHGKAGGADE